jgi:hypothetical protein
LPIIVNGSSFSNAEHYVPQRAIDKIAANAANRKNLFIEVSVCG